MTKTNDQTQSPVLQLITGLGVGGAERVVLELAGRLAKQDCPVIVVALNSDSRLLQQYPNIDFPVRNLGINQKNPFSVLRALFVLISFVHRRKVKIIHAHMFHALLAGLICRLARPSVKLVFTSHSFSGFTPVRQWLIKKTKALRAMDVLFVKDQHKNLNAMNTLVISNGVSIDQNSGLIRPLLATGRRVFLFVGRLEKPKNPLALIDAFAAMQQKNCELWIAGNGTLREEVEQRIISRGVKARVSMLGVCNDLASLYREADCFVMSSSWEGLPMALLEAGGAALPVVAPPVGAIPELWFPHKHRESGGGSRCGNERLRRSQSVRNSTQKKNYEVL
jgi:glycosyltransferase involved in cell wall biosynthesis